MIGVKLGLGALAPAMLLAQAPPLNGLDQYVTATMRAWNVPGLAVAVVKDGKVVVAKGYGIREVGRPDPVTERTLFAIGSATKSFTAAAAGILVTEGRLGWDDRVTKHLPSFEMADPYVTREVTVRDLLTHRTGVSGGDLLWASGGFDREEIVRRIRFVPQTWGLRSRFDYSNIMFIAAGQVVAAASGRSWDTFVRERILTPLGMTATTTSVRDLPQGGGGGDVATPHEPIAGTATPVAWRNMDNTVAGGGINSNVAEMATWLRLQLGNGVLDGRRLLSEAYIRESRTPQTIIRREGAWEEMTPDAHFMTYGFGWIMSDYHGRQLLQHGGGIDGMSAMVGLLPEENLGIVVLTNLNGNLIPGALMYRVFDAYLGRPPLDWSERARVASVAAEKAAEEALRKELAARRVTGTTPTLPLERYVGRYRHPAWGDLVVRLEGGKLVAEYGTEFVGELEHVQFDSWRARWRNPARGADYLNFTIDARREAARVDLYLWVTATFDRVGQ